MDCWWLDETPYPGPHHRPLIPKLPGTAFLSGAEFAALSTAITKAFGLLAEDTKMVMRQLAEAGFRVVPGEAIPLSPAEKREVALRQVQNRNTGPKDITFRRDGRRLR